MVVRTQGHTVLILPGELSIGHTLEQIGYLWNSRRYLQTCCNREQSIPHAHLSLLSRLSNTISRYVGG